MSGRPFLYLSLPGVAFIIGMYWYHRRNKRIRNESGGGGGSNKSKTATTTTETFNSSNTQKTIADNCNENKYKQQNGVVTNGNIANNKPSRSMSINNGSIGHHKHGQPDIEDDISASMKQFGKSAPINIIPNGGSSSAINRISPVLLIQQQNQVDSEVLKSKIQDVEHKILRSIDEDFENLSSPVDLPDSVHNNRISFYTNTRHVNIKRDEPVVIKATTTPKISPENSFLESKYVTSASNDNDLPPCASNIISATTRALSKSPPNNLKSNNNNNSDIAIDLPAIDENKIEVQQKQEQQAQPLQQEQQQQQQVELKEKNEQIIIEQPQQEQQHQTQIHTTNITEIAENVIDNIKSDETITTTTTTTTNVVNDDKRKVDTASPSLSLCSEQSGDSGKGSSLPRSEAARAKTTYEFLLPTILIGHLYGRNRSFINQVKSVSGANVMLLPESHNQPMQKKVVRICVVEGTESEINSALSMIRQRLPLKRYPNFTMQRIQYAQPQTIVPLSTESLLNLQLNLIEGINNDVQVSVVISGNHLFVQQPLHPTHPSLPLLQKGLYDSYTNCETPLLPNIEISAVCVTCISGVWYRVQIVSADPEDEYRCVVRFLDFGGYMNVHFNDLRQIRSDFMSLPFQATECVLSNIEPIGECWTPEAADILCKLTKGIVLQAQVAGYNSLNIPEIYLFASLGPNNVIFINKEIVARNLAKWVD